MPHLTNVCSLCISRLSFPVPCSTACPAVSWSQNSFLRSSLFDVDIKSTNPKESQASLCIRDCVFSGSGRGKRALCNRLLCLPHPDLHQMMNGAITSGTPHPETLWLLLPFAFCSLLRAKSHHQFHPRVMPISII